MAQQTWKQEAACRSIEQGGTLTTEEADKIFYIGPGQKAKRAKAFCGACPVRQACRDYAILYRETGIWGGMTDEERDFVRPLVADMLEIQAKRRGELESRNIADFIPTQRTESQTLSLVDSLEYQAAMENAEVMLFELTLLEEA